MGKLRFSIKSHQATAKKWVRLIFPDKYSICAKEVQQNTLVAIGTMYIDKSMVKFSTTTVLYD